MLITMHICRGNFRSTYIASGGYDQISDAIFDELNVDGLFLEYDDQRSGDFEPLKSFKRDDKIVVLGLITSKFPELENPDSIKERIKEASQYIPLENLALSPQCGFSSTEEGNVLTEEDQWNKIKHMITIAERCVVRTNNSRSAKYLPFYGGCLALCFLPKKRATSIKMLL